MKNAICSCFFSLLVLAPVSAFALPQAGSNEIRIENAVVMQGLGITGLTHAKPGTGNSSSTVFGMGLAYGRFVTDNIELGSSLSIAYLDASEASSATCFGLSPFVRFFNQVSDTAGIFVTGTAGYQIISPEHGSNTNVISVGADVGVEFFIADSWSVRLAPMYRYLHESRSAGKTDLTGSEHDYGLSWGLAGYF